MHLSSPHHVDDIVERRFVLDEIPGILWTPRSASPAEPAPLILAGQPGGPAGLDRTRDRMLDRARRTASSGFATATIELPGSGSRPPLEGMDAVRRELRDTVASGQSVSDDLVDRLVLPLVEAALPEWGAVLDALLERPELRRPVGFSGGNISIGIRMAELEPRMAAAVLFAGSFVPRSIVESARRVAIPVHVLLQWDDEVNDRQAALDLFDALGSEEKTLTANLGGHTGVPEHAGEEAQRFLTRHLAPFIE